LYTLTRVFLLARLSAIGSGRGHDSSQLWLLMTRWKCPHQSTRY
jgi:hypothetical protein